MSRSTLKLRFLRIKLSPLSLHLFDEPFSLLPQVNLLLLEILIFEDMTCPWRLVAPCQAALDVVGRPELCGGAGGGCRGGGGGEHRLHDDEVHGGVPQQEAVHTQDPHQQRPGAGRQVRRVGPGVRHGVLPGGLDNIYLDNIYSLEHLQECIHGSPRLCFKNVSSVI